jgi:hypothetical protein
MKKSSFEDKAAFTEINNTPYPPQRGKTNKEAKKLCFFA